MLALILFAFSARMLFHLFTSCRKSFLAQTEAINARLWQACIHPGDNQ